MAEPATQSDVITLMREHSDIRREAETNTNEIVKEVLKGDYSTRGDIKDTRHDISDMVGSAADRLQADIVSSTTQLTDRFFTVGRDTADLRAQVTGLYVTVKDAAALSASQTENAVLRNTIEGQKNTTYLSDKISNDGEKTRALINDLKTTDLSRMLVERNADLVGARYEGHHWRGNFDQAQWAAMNSQLQAFQSQLQETRQGMVNFGTMAGVGQSSTSNNVR